MSSVPHRASRSRLLPIAVAIASILQTACSAAPQLGDELGVDEQAASVAGTSCSAPQLAVEVRGTVLTLTASATCGSAPEYRFSIQAPGSVWYSEFQPYSTLNSLQTDLAGAWSGRYSVIAHVRESGSAVRYDSYAIDSFLLGSICSGATLTATPGANGQVDLAATATCSTGGDAEYRFLVRAPGATAFSELRGYETGSTFSWDTSKLTVSGRYELRVQARVSGNASTYEAQASTTTMVGGICTEATLTAAQNGAATSLAATASCGGAGAEYRFLVKAPGASSYTELRGWGGAGYEWDTNNLTVPGRYDLLVYARASGNKSAYEAYASSGANVGEACASVGIGATAGTGSSVNVTATASCGGTPEYRFFVRPPGGSYAEVRGWGSPDYVFDYSGRAAGTYGVMVYARVAGHASAYEAYAIRAVFVP